MTTHGDSAKPVPLPDSASELAKNLSGSACSASLSASGQTCRPTVTAFFSPLTQHKRSFRFVYTCKQPIAACPRAQKLGTTIIVTKSCIQPATDFRLKLLSTASSSASFVFRLFNLEPSINSSSLISNEGMLAVKNLSCCRDMSLPIEKRSSKIFRFC